MSTHVHHWLAHGTVWLCVCGARSPWLDLHHSTTKDAT